MIQWYNKILISDSKKKKKEGRSSYLDVSDVAYKVKYLSKIILDIDWYFFLFQELQFWSNNETITIKKNSERDANIKSRRSNDAI